MNYGIGLYKRLTVAGEDIFYDIRNILQANFSKKKIFQNCQMFCKLIRNVRRLLPNLNSEEKKEFQGTYNQCR